MIRRKGVYFWLGFGTALAAPGAWGLLMDLLFNKLPLAAEKTTAGDAWSMVAWGLFIITIALVLELGGREKRYD